MPFFVSIFVVPTVGRIVTPVADVRLVNVSGRLQLITPRISCLKGGIVVA